MDASLTLGCRLWESLAGRRVVPWGATRAPWHSHPSQPPAGPVSQVCRGLPCKSGAQGGSADASESTHLPASFPSFRRNLCLPVTGPVLACEAGQDYSTPAEYLQLVTCSQPVPAPAVAWRGRAWPRSQLRSWGVSPPGQDSQQPVCRARPQANHVLIQTHPSLLGLSSSKPKPGGVGGSFSDFWDQSFNLSFPCPEVGFLILASHTPQETAPCELRSPPPCDTVFPNSSPSPPPGGPVPRCGVPSQAFRGSSPLCSALCFLAPSGAECLSPFRVRVAGSRVNHKYLFPSGSLVKNPPARQEMQVRAHGREDPPPGKDSGNPLQYSCLENPVGRRAWWAAVHGVTEIQTQLTAAGV